MGAVLGREEGGDESVNGGDVVVRQAFTLVFAPEDIAELLEFFEGGGFEVNPGGVGGAFGLKAPAAAEAFSPDLFFFSGFCGDFPDMNVAHDRFLGGAGPEVRKNRRNREGVRQNFGLFCGGALFRGAAGAAVVLGGPGVGG